MKFLVDVYSNSLQENVCTDFIVRSWNKFPQKADFRSLDFVIDRLFMKLFRTNNMDTVRQCQQF